MSIVSRLMQTLPARQRGFTLIELLVVVSLTVVILAVGVPNFQRFIVNNRLKAVNAQLVTDLQFARAEAAARNMPVYWSYRVVPLQQMTCYSIFTTTIEGAECDCSLGVGSACTNVAMKEIRTVHIPFSGSVRLSLPPGGSRVFAFDNVNGGMYYGTTDFGDAALADFVVNTAVISDTSRTLRTSVSPAGRTKVCSAGATSITGYPAC